MTSPASRAGALAIIGLLSVLAPAIGAATALLFVAIAFVVLVTPDDSRLFERLASPGDHETGQLRTLGGFVLSIAVLATLGTVDAFGLSSVIFAMTVLLVAFGHAGDVAARDRGADEAIAAASFIVAGSAAGVAGYAFFVAVPGIAPVEAPALAIFLVVIGTLTASLYRTELLREDPIELVAIGLLLWFFAGIAVELDLGLVLGATAVTLLLGVLAYHTGTVSVAGMLSGMLLALITFVLGGLALFVLLAAFFILGGLSTKYRYAEKAERGVAESDEGRRGTANVMSNGLVALVIVIGWATAEAVAAPVDVVPASIFVLAFAGAVATALADTLASEIGALYDDPRLITTFESVEAGTDGAVTLQGHLAGLVGAVIVAVLAGIGVPTLEPFAAIVVVLAGLVGMTTDSVLGATIEGKFLGNDGVNLVATAVGALAAALGWVVVV